MHAHAAFKHVITHSAFHINSFNITAFNQALSALDNN